MSIINRLHGMIRQTISIINKRNALIIQHMANGNNMPLHYVLMRTHKCFECTNDFTFVVNGLLVITTYHRLHRIQ